MLDQINSLNVWAALGVSAEIMANAAKECNRGASEREQLHMEWLAFLSHDLASPLARVLRGLETLEYESDLNSEERLRILECAKSEVVQLAQAISSISQLAVLDSDIERTFVESSLNSFLEQAADPFAFEADNKNIQLELRVEPDLGHVRIEKNLLRRAIENLISNAIRHTPKGGLISVTAERCGATARIRVTNTGTGIPPEELARIFEFAFQGGGQVRPATVGSLGLGLALVRRVAELHHGEVTARNLEPVGTEFAISLPIAT